MKLSKGRMGRWLLGLAIVVGAVAVSQVAFAELGQPAPWEYKLQEIRLSCHGPHRVVP